MIDVYVKIEPAVNDDEIEIGGISVVFVDKEYFDKYHSIDFETSPIYWDIVEAFGRVANVYSECENTLDIPDETITFESLKTAMAIEGYNLIENDDII